METESKHILKHSELATKREVAEVLYTLSQCHNWGIGTEVDHAKAYHYNLEAAKRGLSNARYMVLMRAEIDEQPIPGVLAAERLEWIMDILFGYASDDLAASMRSTLRELDDIDLALELCSFALVSTFGQNYKYTRPREVVEPEDLAPFIKADDSGMLRELIKRWKADGISPSEINDLLGFALRLAVQSQKYAVVKEVLKCGDLDLASKDVGLAVKYCISAGDDKAFIIFLESSVPINISAILDDTDILTATVNRTNVIVPYIHRHLRKQKEQRSKQRTDSSPTPASSSSLLQETRGEPLEVLETSVMHAVIMAMNWPNFCDLLAEPDADANEVSMTTPHRTLLRTAVALQRPLFTLALIAKGASIGRVCEPTIPGAPQETTLLHIQCRTVRVLCRFPQHTLYVVDTELKRDWPLEEPDEMPQSIGCWKALVLLLIKAGIDVNSTDSYGLTPIRYLLRRQHNVESLKERLTFLHQLGASLDILAVDGTYALDTIRINQEQDLDVIDFVVRNTAPDILDCGCEPFPEDKETPFHEASFYGNLQLCRRLIARGVRITMRDKIMFNHHIYKSSNGVFKCFYQRLKPRTHLDEAKSSEEIHSYLPISSNAPGISVFIDCVAPHLNSADIVGRTRLHIAVLQKDVESVQLLVDQGAFQTIRDWLGLTAAHFAHAVQDDTIISILEEVESHSVQPTIRLSEEPASTVPPPLEFGKIFKQRPELWAKLCESYEDEMARRSELWPEKHFVIGTKSIDFRDILGYGDPIQVVLPIFQPQLPPFE